MLSTGLFPAPQFAGRYKTKRETQMDIKPLTGSLTSTGVATVGGGAVGSVGLLGSLGVLNPAVAVGLSHAMPYIVAGAGGLAALDIKSVERQIPLTPAEEEAQMTPIEKAHRAVDTMLDKIKAKRSEQKELLSRQQTALDVALNEQKKLKQDLERIQRDASGYQADYDRSQSSNRRGQQDPQWVKNKLNTCLEQIDQLELQLEAKAKTVLQWQNILEKATGVFAESEQQLKRKEAKCYETREQIKMMESHEALLQMHQNLKDAKDQNLDPASNDLKQKLTLDYQKVQVQLEDMVKQMQLEADVDAAIQQAENRTQSAPASS